MTYGTVNISFTVVSTLQGFNREEVKGSRAPGAALGGRQNYKNIICILMFPGTSWEGDRYATQRLSKATETLAATLLYCLMKCYTILNVTDGEKIFNIHWSSCLSIIQQMLIKHCLSIQKFTKDQYGYRITKQVHKNLVLDWIWFTRYLTYML